MNIEQEIRSILSSIGGIPENADSNADLYLDLGMASVHALQLLTELEERFGISIPDDAFVEANTIARLTSTVEGLVRVPR
jgi:acyl carrier protein